MQDATTIDGAQRVEISVGSTVLAAGDARLDEERAQLLREVRAVLGGPSVVVPSAVAGAKGGGEAVAVVVASGTAARALATVFRDWINRSADRTITVTTGRGTVTVGGEKVHERALVESLRAVLDHEVDA